MPRYVRQPHIYSCGPVAILNVMKWAGHQYTILHDYDRLIESCDCDENGTNTPNFDRTLREESNGFITVKRKYRPTLKEIEQWIKISHQSIILLYWGFGRIECGHYTLITDPTTDGKYFEAINDGPKKRWMTRSQLKQFLNYRRRKKVDIPCVWFLKVNLS